MNYKTCLYNIVLTSIDGFLPWSLFLLCCIRISSLYQAQKFIAKSTSLPYLVQVCCSSSMVPQQEAKNPKCKRFISTRTRRKSHDLEQGTIPQIGVYTHYSISRNQTVSKETCVQAVNAQDSARMNSLLQQWNYSYWQKNWTIWAHCNNFEKPFNINAVKALLIARLMLTFKTTLKAPNIQINLVHLVISITSTWRHIQMNSTYLNAEDYLWHLSCLLFWICLQNWGKAEKREADSISDIKAESSVKHTASEILNAALETEMQTSFTQKITKCLAEGGDLPNVKKECLAMAQVVRGTNSDAETKARLESNTITNHAKHSSKAKFDSIASSLAPLTSTLDQASTFYIYIYSSHIWSTKHFSFNIQLDKYLSF